MHQVSKEAGSGSSAHPLSPRLKILIVGAGIGGLTAAIGLRKQGHTVQVFESGKEVRGVGYGIHLAPNGVGLLRFLGVDIEGGGAVPMNRIRFFKQNGDLFNDEDRTATAHKWQNQWFLASRVVLHEQLLKLATDSDLEGEPVRIYTASRLVDLDYETGLIRLEDGREVAGDVIIGADGVNSRARAAIADVKPYPSRYNCFRMMLKREDVLSDSSTHHPLDETMDFVYSPKTKAVLYPTLNNTFYNCVITHLTELTSGYTGDPKEKMMEICADHTSAFRNLFTKAAPERFRIWPLYDMEILPTFHKGRLVVVGDAAHPFTPHLAQGGVMALEDAMSVMVMLSRGVTRDDVVARLELYNDARHARGTLMQKTSLIVGGDRVDDHPDADNKHLNVQKYLDLALSHDEIHASSQILRKYLWKQNESTWSQPTAFGPLSRCSQQSQTRNQLTAVIRFKTSGTLLRNFFPNKSYTFDRTDTVAEVTICAQRNPLSQFLGVGPENRVALFVQNVAYASLDGLTEEKGVYCPVIFEDSAEAICRGREHLGLPIIFSNIVIVEESGNVKIRLDYEGHEWATFDVKNLQSSSEGTVHAVPANSGLLVHKYIPASGHSRTTTSSADANYDIFYPCVADKVMPEVRCSKEADINVKNLGTKDLPTLHHIAERLSELPIIEVVGTTLVKQSFELFDWALGTRL